MGALFQLRRLSFMVLWAAGVVLLPHTLANVAHATCGDYLMIEGDEHQDARENKAIWSGEDEHRESPCPCTGIWCHGVPHPAPGRPERSLTYDLEHWCVPPGHGINLPAIRSMMGGRDVLLMPPEVTTRIDRPPRVCAHLG